MVSEKKIFFMLLFFFPKCKSLGANDPQDGAVFDPRGMIGRIYVGYHKILIHAKKVQVGKDQEKAQSEKDSHSKNRGGKKPN